VERIVHLKGNSMPTLTKKAFMVSKRLVAEVVGGIALVGAGYGIHSAMQRVEKDTKPMDLKKGPSYMSDEEVTALYLSTKGMSEFFSRNNITHWAISGTLIGALRNHPPGALRWDDDSDFAMFLEDKDKLEKAMHEDEQFTKEFDWTLAGFGYQYRLKKYADLGKEYNVDMFIYKQAGHDKYEIQDGKWGGMDFTGKDKVLPTRKCKFWDFLIQCPHKLDAPLDEYGGRVVLTQARMWSHASSVDGVVNLTETANQAFLVPMLNMELVSKLVFAPTKQPMYNYEELDE
jgi:hypothetical protein